MVRRAHKRAKSGKDFKRRPASRKERARVLIVTECAKIEPDYFTRLIRELGLTTAMVRVAGDGGSAPISVVEHAQNLLQRDPDIEEVYLVFDRDRHASYDEAIAIAQGLGRHKAHRSRKLAVVPSVPCFEIWYLFHVSDSRKPYEAAATGSSPAATLIEDLKKAHEIFAQYKKAGCEDYYQQLCGERETAKKRAQTALNDAKDEGQKKFHENPSTRVHRLVDRLEVISREQKENG